MTQSYRALISYDGTDFCGWQVQKHQPTVAGRLIKAFEATFSCPVQILGASRTDAGVHALGQVVRMRTPLDLDPQTMPRTLNNHLPACIAIRDLSKMPPSFHPFNGVKRKIYWYHIFYKRPLPFVARYGWHYPYAAAVDWEKLAQMLAIYQGTHDFASYITNDQKVETVRTIDEIKLEHLKQFGAYRVVVIGKGFARFQIRRMIGYALDVARRPELSARTLEKLLENPVPLQTLEKAAACGLMLRKIEYHE